MRTAEAPIAAIAVATVAVATAVIAAAVIEPENLSRMMASFGLAVRRGPPDEIRIYPMVALFGIGR
jgi:hypothetical protein